MVWVRIHDFEWFLTHALGILLTGTEITSRSGAGYEVLLLATSGKHKSFGNLATLQLDSKSIAHKGRKVYPTTIKFNITKDHDISEILNLVEAACAGEDVEWDSLPPWWEGSDGDSELTNQFLLLGKSIKNLRSYGRQFKIWKIATKLLKTR